jgi:hypothetical protein
MDLDGAEGQGRFKYMRMLVRSLSPVPFLLLAR